MWGLVGPEAEAMPRELLAGFGEFYRRMLSHQILDVATQGLADNVGSAVLLPSEVVLARFWQHPLALLPPEGPTCAASVQMLRQRLDLPPIDHSAPDALRRTFEEHRRRYLWLDQFPEEERRFPLTFPGSSTSPWVSMTSDDPHHRAFRTNELRRDAAVAPARFCGCASTTPFGS